jgi:hypothetical protein
LVKISFVAAIKLIFGRSFLMGIIETRGTNLNTQIAIIIPKIDMNGRASSEKAAVIEDEINGPIEKPIVPIAMKRAMFLLISLELK